MTTDDALVVIRRYAKDVEILRVERDRAIKRARIEGKSVKEIADAAFMTRQGISKVLVRLTNKLPESLDN